MSFYIGPLAKIEKYKFDINIFHELPLCGIKQRISLSYYGNYIYFGPNHGIDLDRDIRFDFDYREEVETIELPKIHQEEEIRAFVIQYKEELRELENAFGVGTIEVCWGIQN